MKIAVRLAVFCLLIAAPLVAQIPPVSPIEVLRRPGWEKGVFVGGGTSVGSTPSGQNFVFGLRIGRILTNEHGSGLLRGTFEWAGDIIPVDEYWIHGAQYSGGLDPIVWKWNFTHGCTVSPYAAIVGGVLFSTHNLPPGDTAQINFTPGAEFGAQIFRKGTNTINLSMKVYHLSNASIGNHNPGLNANLQFMLGYSWH